MGLSEIFTEINQILEDDITEKQMGIIIVVWMAGLAVFGIVAYLLIHVILGH